MRRFPFFGLLVTCTILCFCTGYGQQQSSLIPPPPEASSFFKSTDIPVSMYTGLSNIGVDFYTIKTKELSIPIRINYNARGIQVAEIASRAGIGWALQYGGMISRQIRGSADETPYGILNHNYYNEIFTDSSARGSMMSDIVNNNIDEFPDQFYYDVNGESGKFTIDHNDGNVVLQKFDDIKIVPSFSNNEIVSWVVTDKLGNKYYYGHSKDATRQAIDYDLSEQNFTFSDVFGMTQSNSDGEHTNSAWHLMEIETYLHERVQFIYELEEGIQYRRYYDNIVPAYSSSNSLEDSYSVTAYEKCVFSRITSHQYQIKEIQFPGGKVLFEGENNERKDFTNTHALHSVFVKNAQDSVVKKFDLNYFYQRCPDDNNQLPYLKEIDTAANYRLFLSTVRETNGAGGSLPPYQFEYNNTLLPNRFSNAQDNWGYYNGKPNGRYLTFFTFNTLVNRTVDTALCGAGLLQKITYPTGGSSHFTYEQNRVMPPAFIHELLTNQNNPVDTVSLGDAFFKDTAYYANGMYSKVMTIGQNIAPSNSVSFSFIQPFQIDTTIISYQVILERLDSIGTIYLYPSDRERQLNLSPGQYRLEVIPTANTDSSAFIASLQWTAIIPNPELLANGEWYGAGKRIKRIEHRNANELVSFKAYEYLDSTGKTSGKMLGLPNFYFINRLFPYTGGAPMVDQYGSLPGSPMTQLQGNSIGYARVTEYYGDSSINQGKAVNEFTIDEDAGDYYEFPYHLPIDFEWLRGKPLRTKVYKKTTNGYELQKSTENSYLYAGATNTPNLFAQPFVNMDSVFVYHKNRNLYYLPLFIFKQADNISNQDYKIYYQSAGTIDLASTIEKEYTNGSELSQITEYGYNYAQHYQPIVQRTKTSKGDSAIANTYFPLDLTNRTAAEQKLVDLNRIAIPVKLETNVKNSTNLILSSSVKNTVYKDWGNNLVLSEHLQSSINNAALEDDITYDSYDSIGSPLEIMPKNGIKEVYVWGYKRQYPVAKIVGSDYTTIISLVDTTLLANAAQYSDTQVRTELQKIRTGLAGTRAQVFTYTYKPMVGISSITDQRNQTVYYEYDAFNRLSVIKDQNNYILKKYCYNYTGQSNGCSIGCANTNPNWQAIDSICQQNVQNQNTGYKLVTKKDINPCSNSYNATHVDTILNCITCPKPANWQSTANYRCIKDGSNNNTGYQEREEKDMETCSSTYNQTRWVSNGYNTSSCPLPSTCNSANCESQGPEYKCINGSCEMGYKVFTASYYDESAGQNICIYHYEWSDNSWSQDYTQYSGPFSCNVGGGPLN